MVYVAVAVVVVLAVAGVVLLNNSPTSPAQATTSVLYTTSTGANTGSTSPTSTAGFQSTLVTSITNVSYNATTSVTPPSCSSLPGYDCVSIKCNPVNSSFACGNATYAYSSTNSTTYLWVTVGQTTGTYWSGWGAAFVPNGTKISQGVPQNIQYNTATSQSTSNVGTNMTSGGSSVVKADNGMTGAGYGKSPSGSVWICYTNSGILYVGVGCTTSNRIPATYVEVGTISTV